MPSTSNLTARSFRYWLLGILFLGGLWRVVIAALMPAISRDGVTFCWFARSLGEHGLAYLRSPEAEQHPLFPALILCVHRLLLLCGAADTPLTWQLSGQMLSWIAGMTVIGLAAAIAFRLVRCLELPLDPQRVALCAAALAAVLPLNVWLSADVMSDEIHLAFYLGAALLMLKMKGHVAAAGVGMLGGLAFVTRQEGVMIVLAGLATVAAHRRLQPARRLAVQGLLVVVGFLVFAAPYWMAAGQLSAKKNPLDWFRRSTALRLPCGQGATVERSRSSNAGAVVAATGDPRVQFAGGACVSGWGPMTLLAKLRRQDLPWYLLIPYAVYQLVRAGRVVVVLLAIMPLLNLRRRLMGPQLAGITTCAVGHFALTLILLQRYDYLDMRHMLVPVALLVPFAALLLSRLVHLALERCKRALAVGIVVVVFLPLAAYSLRVPNGEDGYIREIANWLRAHDPQLSSKTLLSGSSGRRIAFYANVRWQPWPERAEDYQVLVDHVSVSVPGYFIAELGSGYERAGMRQAVDRLLADPTIDVALSEVYSRQILAGELLVFQICTR